MSSLRMELTVTYLDGRPPQTVTAGQREMAAWEREPFGCGTGVAETQKPMLFARYLAWRALAFGGLRTGFAAWDETVDMVDMVDDEATADEADPTGADRPPGA
jgi:anti-sigma factor RsiW